MKVDRDYENINFQEDVIGSENLVQRFRNSKNSDNLKNGVMTILYASLVNIKYV